MNRTVSIIIDNYNYARFLPQAIDSALAQTYPHVEVVVVDDGSTDDSREIIRSYGDKIRPVFKENGGQASAFNAGFAASQGEIVAWLDADDYYAPHAIERIVSAWTETVNILHHRLRTVDAGNRELGWYPVAGDTLDSGNVVPILLRTGAYVCPPTSGLAYSRKLLQKIMPIPEADFRMCAENYIYLTAPFLASVTVLDETLAYYRIHDSNAHMGVRRRQTTRKKLEVAQKYFEMRHELLKKLFVEHGFPTQNFNGWENSGYLFERLLLLRESSSAGMKAARLAATIMQKLWSEPLSLRERFRQSLSTLIIWLAPRAVLVRLYPNLFLR